MYRERVLRLVALLVLAGCINQASSVFGTSSPPPAQSQPSGGTATCREIVETCDAQCTTPFCLNECTARGNPLGQQQHAALLDCAQRNGCMDEACVRTSCPNESAACETSGPPPAAPPPP